MEFFIKQNTNLPILKMDVIRDGRTDSWKNFYEILDNANIRFSMKSEDNGIQKIFMQPAYITEKNRTNPDSDREYYIYSFFGTVFSNRSPYSGFIRYSNSLHKGYYPIYFT
jgi:hypothetical protein